MGSISQCSTAGRLTRWGVVALSCAAWSFGWAAAWADDDDRDRDNDDRIPLTVPKAHCGSEDHPETALQGQVPAALRAAGFKGFNCNLKLVGQSRGEGANWQTTEYKDRHGHICAYHGTASPSFNPTRQHFGVPVIDVTNESKPTPVTYLNTTSMLDPWESLKVNERRRVLGADNGQNGGGGPEVDLYDISTDCRYPQLLDPAPGTNSVGAPNTIALTTAKDANGKLAIIGHEGAWAPDGLTYYGGDLTHAQYYAVDTTNPREPKLITTWVPGFANVHGLSISDDGKRGYFVSLGGLGGNPADLTNPAVPATNGFMIYDLSEIQARKPNAQAHLISTFFFKDGSVAQHTIPVKIKGKSYIIHVDEGGSGGISSAAQEAAACAANLPPFPMPRIVDISDEKHPKLASRVMLETHDPKNCKAVLPDIVGLSIFTYGSHYCSVDNKHNATTLACGFFNSGIRVFDIRDPYRPREIAYYNPAGVTTASAGTNHTAGGNWKPGGPDWCSAQVHLDAQRGTLWTTCQDNGLLMLKFERGVWPFEDSWTPPGQQN